MLFAVFALVALNQPVLALNPENRISQYGHVVWRVQDGVLGGNPTAFAQTADGYIWIGTQSGLYRFDGASFVPWNPPPGQRYPFGISTIFALHAGRDGSLWIGSGGGLTHLANGTFTSVEAPNSEVDAIAEDGDGALWITRSHVHEFTGPICRVSDGVEQCFGTSQGIQATAASSIAVDSRGNFWIGGVGSLIERRGKNLQEHFLAGASAPDMSRIIEAVATDADGVVWTGENRTGPRDGLQIFSNGSWHPFTTQGFNGADLDVRALLVDRDHCLWVGTANQGIYRIHGQSVDHFRREDGLSSNSVFQIFQDSEGDIWVATGEGIDHFRDLAILTYSSLQGIKTEYISAILARHDGSINASSVRSLDSIRSSTVTPRKMPPGVHGNVTAMLEDHRGNLWIGGDGGLMVQVDGHWSVVTNGNSIDTVLSLAEDTDHAIWAEIAGPNARLIGVKDFEVREEFKPPAIPAAYFVFADPHQGIWLSLLDGRLMHRQGNKWKEISMEPLVKKYSRVGGIFNATVDSDGTFWGAAGSGVIGLRNGNLQLLNKRNGMPCQATYATASDLHGDLWILAQCGLMRIKKSELERWWSDPEVGVEVSTFTASDGFRSGIPLTHPALVRGADGKLWFHNQNVVMMVDPDHLPSNNVPPPVHVDQVVADHHKYEILEDLRLPAMTREVEIHYSGLSFVAPSKVLFRYMLEGYDTQWQEPGVRRTAFYNDLGPGKYTFRVIACNSSGVWSTDGASLEFRVLPAYFQTNLFRAACVAVVLVLGWTMYRLRMRHMRRQLEIGMEARVNERTRIARELHDTLLQSLHGLMFQFQAARNMLPNRPDDARQTLDGAISETEHAIAESRDAIQNLRSERVSSGDLASLLEAAAKELSAVQNKDQISPSFRVIIEGEPRKLFPEMQGEVYKIACEVLRNAYRHANAGQIEAEIRYDHHQLRVRVRDDGKGIEPKVLDESRRQGHWGLPGIRERALQIGMQLRFWSNASAGTEVELTIPAAVAYQGSRKEYRFRFFRREQMRA